MGWQQQQQQKLEEITAACLYGESTRFSGDKDEPGTCMASFEPLEEEQRRQGRKSSFQVKLDSRRDELKHGVHYRLWGRWVEHRKYGRQFHAQAWALARPHGRQAVVRYLQLAPWIGPAGAEKLWQNFAGDAVRVAREQPEVISSLIGGSLNLERAKEAAKWFATQQACEETMIGLTDLLQGRGFPKATAKRALDKWGSRAVEIINRNPYALMAFRGCGFGKTDAMWLELGKPAGAMKRQALCAWYTVATDSEGHTWFPVEFVERGLRRRIAGADVQPVAAIKLTLRARLLAKRRDERGRLWLAEFRKAEAERKVAEWAASKAAEPSNWPSVDAVPRISEHQREELRKALRSPLAILTGGPGTGKTFTVANLVPLLAACGGKVAAAAPTGKAAVRLTEVLAGYGLELKATTIHSLLKVQSAPGEGSRDSDDEWEFGSGEFKPLDCRWLLVDESSMIDASLMAALAKAIARGTHVLFIGDINQLLPVGHGAPLRDLIGAGASCGELTEIRRNAGSIVRACDAIRRGQPIQYDQAIDLEVEPPRNLMLIEAATPEIQKANLLKLLDKLKQNRGENVWGVQVLAAVNKSGPLSRRAINLLLQSHLNPNIDGASRDTLRLNDKVVNTKNGSYRDVVGGLDVRVANGEIGEVTEISPGRMTVKLTSPDRIILVPRGQQDRESDSDRVKRHQASDPNQAAKDRKEGANAENSSGDSDSGNDSGKTLVDTGCNWDLGYCLSTHKAQGSEWPVVIVMLDDSPGASRLCSREWLFTAASRAKEMEFQIGKQETSLRMSRLTTIHRRKTFLVERIAEEQAKLVQERRLSQPLLVAASDAANVDLSTEAESHDTAAISVG